MLQRIAPSFRRLSFCLAICLLAGGWGYGVQLAFAHKESDSGVVTLAPFCSVVANRCVAKSFAPAANVIVPFPPLAANNQLTLTFDGSEVHEALAPLHDLPCQAGFADIYPCRNVDLLAFLPLSEFGSSAGNTLWGWTDPVTHKEYAIAGVLDGAVFVDISNPTQPRYVGKLATHSGKSSKWHDMKVYRHYAFLVSDYNPGNGMQVFDLNQLGALTTTTPISLSEVAAYNVFSSSHNIVINEASGFAYAVGTETCGGGLHMINIRDPLHPTQAGCYREDGYIHDAQCIVYDGPDTAYTGHEICVNASVSKLSVVDVSDKTSPALIAFARWAGIGYVHQAWFTPDRQYLLLDDEFDEHFYHHTARTYVFNMRKLDHPTLMGAYSSALTSVDHNIYISGTYAFEANYTTGLRVLDLQHVDKPFLKEAAYFDTFPGDDLPNFTGAWSAYPFFPSGVVIVSTIDRGLFILRPHLQAEPFTVYQVALPMIMTK